MFPENCLTQANLGPCKLQWLRNGGFGESSQACLPPSSISLTSSLHRSGLLASYPGASALAVLTLGCFPPYHSSLLKLSPPHSPPFLRSRAFPSLLPSLVFIRMFTAARHFLLCLVFFLPVPHLESKLPKHKDMVSFTRYLQH